MPTLQVTNGDSVAGTLAEIAPTGEPILPWRDILHDGPVPAGLTPEAFRETRAQFLASRGFTRYELALADLQGRDAQLAAAGRGDVVLLWFEPDLYDQLQVLQILNHFYLRPLSERPTIAITAADELLGPLSKFELGRYIELQRTVREVDLELAAQGWEAFTASDPSLIKAFAKTETEIFAADSYRNDRVVVLPYVHSALRRVLQEYPSEENGLSRTEQQTVDALLKGARSLGDTYHAAHQKPEEMAWLGDLSFAWYVDRMMSGVVPLIEFVPASDGAPVPAAGFSLRLESDPSVWKKHVRLTQAGVDVAEKRAHAVALNGIDRWIGGVHLQAEPQQTATA